MRTFLALAMAAGIVTPGQEPKVDVTVEGRYETPGGIVIETLGGCSIGVPDSVSCWDMAGKADEALTKQVKAGLLASGQDINFRFGQELRCLVVRRPRSLGVNYQTPGGSYMQNVYLQRGFDESQLDLLFPRLDTETNRVDVTVNLYNADPPRFVDVPFRKGERFKVDKAEFEIGEATPFKMPKPVPNGGVGVYRWPNMGQPGVTPFNGAFFPDSKIWVVGFGYQQPDEKRYLNSFLVFDREGRPITYTDKNGEPVPATQVLATEPPPFPGFQTDPNVKPPKYRPVGIYQSGIEIAGAFGFGLNVNPERIGKIRVAIPSQRTIRFKNVPINGS